MGKLGYRKSRQGCTLCKQRHVKCDELRPCTACRRHGAECSLLPQPEEVDGSTPPEPLRKVEAIPVAPLKIRRKRGRPPKNRNRGVASRPPDLSGVGLDSPARFGADWTTDLELMHQYTTVTHTTFPLHPSARQTYNTDILRLAFKYPYLLHLVLAMSAYHLVFLHPESGAKYRLAGSVHQGRALSGMRHALETEMTEGSALALFASAGFLMATAYASLNREETPTSDDDCHQTVISDMLNVMYLQRGVQVMKLTAVRQFLRDPVDVLLGDFSIHVEPGDPDMEVIRGKILETRDRLLSSDGTMGLEVNPSVIDALTALLDAMDPKVLTKLIAGPLLKARAPALRAVFRWPGSISEEFLQLIRRHDKGALTVLLFFCVLLKAVECDCWFFTGWESRISGAVLHYLGETAWTEIARWPMERLELNAEVLPLRNGPP